MKKELFEQARAVHTVSEITRNIKKILENAYPAVWVEGEVSNLSCPSSGHVYFTLKDKSAELKAVLFRSQAQRVKFEMQDGLGLLCFGKISVYETRGQYQLYVEELEPKGFGALQLAFEQLKKKLAKEGLFDETHKISLPYLPARVGVVTSPTGAAIRDILNVLKRRYTNIEVIISPVRVQGEGAAEEIKEAIKLFNEFKEVDVLIVGRGGGSLEDLWPFNEEVVARAIYNSTIPIISAVGHEIDWTIADMVADERAPTPSAAAEIVIPRKEELRAKVRDAYSRLRYAVDSRISQRGERLDALRKRLALNHPENLILQYAQRLDDVGNQLYAYVAHHLKLNAERFAASRKRLLLSYPGNVILRYEQKLNEAGVQLNAYIMYYFRLTEEKMKSLTGKFEAVSPLTVLSRGYSITMKDGQVLRESNRVKKGDRVTTKLFKGGFVSEVK